ncbi:MAG: hypothetical protein C4339_06445 [Nitrososphaerota archaeon]|mgnify:CR=1 FL=1
MRLEGWSYALQLLAGLDLILSYGALPGVAWRGSWLGLPMLLLGLLLIASVPFIWLGSRRLGLLVLALSPLGLTAWATLGLGRYSYADLVGMALLAACFMASLAWRVSIGRRKGRGFHPLDYPVYG